MVSEKPMNCLFVLLQIYKALKLDQVYNPCMDSVVQKTTGNYLKWS